MARAQPPFISCSWRSRLELDPRLCRLRRHLPAGWLGVRGSTSIASGCSPMARMRKHRWTIRNCTKVFPAVKIRGGISYFLWDREHKGHATCRPSGTANLPGPFCALPPSTPTIFSCGATRRCQFWRRVRAKERANRLESRISSRKLVRACDEL